jgi:pimeloyl-ACP methyl ester carboxylesterase
MASFDYDVVIIGSGFGGSVAAFRAAEKGGRGSIQIRASMLILGNATAREAFLRTQRVERSGRRDFRGKICAARKQDREPLSGPKVAQAQITAFRAWEAFSGGRFAKLRKISQPCLVVNGVFDNPIPIRNSYLLSEHLPNAMLLTYPDAGHGSLFQFHESFVRQASLFLGSKSPWPS